MPRFAGVPRVCLRIVPRFGPRRSVSATAGGGRILLAAALILAVTVTNARAQQPADTAPAAPTVAKCSRGTRCRSGQSSAAGPSFLVTPVTAKSSTMGRGKRPI